MKHSPSHPLRRASQLAEQLFEKADVESAYDAHGHLKFLVARVPRADFFQLYGQSTFATLFHRGHWLEFSRQGRTISINERASASRFQLELRTNSFGWAQLTLTKKSKVVWKRALTPEELDGFELTHDLLQAVARMCAKQMGEIPLYTDDGRVSEDVPTIHILPETEEGPEFSSSNVNMQ